MEHEFDLTRVQVKKKFDLVGIELKHEFNLILIGLVEKSYINRFLKFIYYYWFK
jgi:hypothetical protein